MPSVRGTFCRRNCYRKAFKGAGEKSRYKGDAGDHPRGGRRLAIVAEACFVGFWGGAWLRRVSVLFRYSPPMMRKKTSLRAFSKS